MLRSLKQRLRRSRLMRHGVEEELDWPIVTLGSGGGAWTIHVDRLGPTSVVYAFGVGTDISFDLAVIRAFGANVHAFDPTPVAKQWIADQTLPPNFHFHAYGIADFDGTLDFYPPRSASSSHYTPVVRHRGVQTATSRVQGQVCRLPTIMQRLGHTRIDLIKMDIEGGEYAVIDDMLATGIPIGQLAVEFHHAYATIPLTRTVRAVERLRDDGFRILHISPRTYEMTFIRPEFAQP